SLYTALMPERRGMETEMERWRARTAEEKRGDGETCSARDFGYRLYAEQVPLSAISKSPVSVSALGLSEDLASLCAQRSTKNVGGEIYERWRLSCG
ncbi:hypothetical protein JOQ06_022406, partial [Pogonophryne albipinna]